jgi:hypothetical protein
MVPTKTNQGPTMKLGYTIIYVPSVESSLRFFNQAFGLQQKFLHESGDYGELNTGETTLAFASHALGKLNFPDGHVQASESKQPLGMEIALVTDDVHPRKNLGAKWCHMCARRTALWWSCARLCMGDELESAWSEFGAYK